MDILALSLICFTCFVLGAFLMWYNMRKEVAQWQVKYDDMRTAFQHKHAQNQQMWLTQEKLLTVCQELLTGSKVKQ